MLIDTVIQTPSGAVTFKGELSPLETEAVVRAGLNWLLQAGALPVLIEGDNIHIGDTQEQ